MNISVLLEKPKLDKEAILFIEPLAPLSLVTSMPGAYYRSQREPSNFMIYGMLENLLGWHFSNEGNEKLRDAIIKDLKKHHEKQHKLKLEFKKNQVGFKPLLQFHLEIEKLLLMPHITSFEDYWTQHLRDEDERHAKGTRNYDYKIEKKVNQIYSLPKEKRDLEWRTLFDKNKNGAFPAYYQAPTKREFIVVNGKYGYSIKANNSLLELLFEFVNRLEHPLYLGTNEGWVHLNIKKL